MDVCSYGRLLHLLISGGNAPVANIIANVIIEQHSILRDHADMSAQ